MVVVEAEVEVDAGLVGAGDEVWSLGSRGRGDLEFGRESVEGCAFFIQGDDDDDEEEEEEEDEDTFDLDNFTLMLADPKSVVFLRLLRSFPLLIDCSDESAVSLLLLLLLSRLTDDEVGVMTKGEDEDKDEDEALL